MQIKKSLGMGEIMTWKQKALKVQIAFYVWSLNKVFLQNKNLVKMRSIQYSLSNRKVKPISVCSFIELANCLNYNPSFLLNCNMAMKDLASLWIRYCCKCQVRKKNHPLIKANTHTHTHKNKGQRKTFAGWCFCREHSSQCCQTWTFSVSLLTLLILCFLSN